MTNKENTKVGTAIVTQSHFDANWREKKEIWRQSQWHFFRPNLAVALFTEYNVIFFATYYHTWLLPWIVMWKKVLANKTKMPFMSLAPPTFKSMIRPRKLSGWWQKLHNSEHQSKTSWCNCNWELSHAVKLRMVLWKFQCQWDTTILNCPKLNSKWPQLWPRH